MVYCPSNEFKVVTFPNQKVFGDDLYNLAFQNQWVEMVYDLGIGIYINRIDLIPSSGSTFYVDELFIDGNPTPKTVYMPDTQVPEEIKKEIVISNKVVVQTAGMNLNYIVDGKSELHFSYGTSPLVRSTVQLNFNDAWLFFDNIRPSKVNGTTEALLKKVFINAEKATIGVNARLEIYGEGTVVIPHGRFYKPLTVYTEPELKGNTTSYGLEAYYSNLGVFSKKISSFVLKRGYMATFFQNANGIGGISRVYIADVKDLIVTNLPIELDGQITRLRVLPWRYVTKKGYCGGGQPNDTELLGGTWFYTWSADRSGSANQDFVPMRHGKWWPDYAEINAKTAVNHVLGFNEPDHTDQSDMTIQEMVNQWPQLLASGLRVGAPSYANFDGGTENFLKECEHRNLRVDFVPVHSYYGNQEKAWWVNYVNRLFDVGRRPVWITEWNNGANWTGESGNDAEQAKDVAYIQDSFEEAPFLERYSIFNWVETWREVIRDGALTQAGVVYRNRKSEMAYNPAFEYIQNPVVEKNLKFAIVNKRDGLLYQEGNKLKTSGTFSTTNLIDKYLWTFEYSKQEIGGYKLINCATNQAVTFNQSKLMDGFFPSDKTNSLNQNLSIAAYSTENKSKNQPRTYYTISYYNNAFQFNYQAMDGYPSNNVGSYDITRVNNQQWAIIPQSKFTVEGNKSYQIISNTSEQFLSKKTDFVLFEQNPDSLSSTWNIIQLKNGKFMLLNSQTNLALSSKISNFEWQEIDSINTEQTFTIQFAYRENGISFYCIQDFRKRNLQSEVDGRLSALASTYTLNNQLFRFISNDVSLTNLIKPKADNTFGLNCLINNDDNTVTCKYYLNSHSNSLTMSVFNMSGILVAKNNLPVSIGENIYIWKRNSIPAGMYIFVISSSDYLSGNNPTKLILN